MATILKLITKPVGSRDTWLTTWSSLANGDDGDPLLMSGATDRSVQVTGVFGGGQVVVEGSNDGTTWATLTDPQGTSLSFTSSRLKAISEATAYIRPRVVSGDGTTALNVYILGKGQVN